MPMHYPDYGTRSVYRGWQRNHFRGVVNDTLIDRTWFFVGSQWTREQPAEPAPPPLHDKFIAFIAAAINAVEGAVDRADAARAFAYAMRVTGGRPEHGPHNFGRLHFQPQGA